MSGNGVLDKNDQSAEESIRPEFLQDGSHDDLGMSDEARQAETGSLNNDFYSPEASPAEIKSGESAGKTSGEEPTLSDNAEIQKLENTLYRGEQPKGPFAGLRAANKRRKFMAGLAGGGIVGLVIGGLFMLPLKVMHISENLQDTFFSSSEEASEEISSRLLSSYLIYKVIPGLNGSCTSTKVDKSCAVVDEKDNYVTQLYRAWRDNNLEGKLAKKHGIEIQRNGNKYTVIVGKATIEYEDADGKKSYQSDMMKDFTSRKEVRREFLRAIENETFYKRIMYRYKYGSLMERKYGIVRCVIACEYRNDRADKKELRKMKFKAWVIHRVIGPLNEGYSLAFECAVSNFDCAKESEAEVDDDGTKKTEFENKLREATKTAIGDGRMTKERLAEMQKNADDIRNNGLANHLLKKIFGEAGGKIAGGSIAGAGIIDLLATFVDGISNAGTAIKTMNYALKTGAAVQVYSMYRTNADEVKASGISDIEELGYVSESLGDSFGKDQGGGGAEASPYYSDLFGSQGINTASLSLFPKAEAASPYKCDDGTSIASGLCPEMSVAATTAGADTISSLGDFFKGSGLDVLAGAWNSTIGKAFDAANNLIGFILDPLGDLAGKLTPDFIKDKAADIAKSLGEWFTEKLFVNFMTKDPSGGRMFEAAALGANVAGNDYAHYGLGAGKISDQAANEIRYARAIERQQEFAQQPFLARMFDTSNSYSMVSRMALSNPIGSGSSPSLASTLLSPVKMVSSAMPSLNKASAAPTKNLDLAGVTQYGYTGNEDIFSTNDLEGYWESNNCDDQEQMKAWGESAKLSGNNGSFENDTPYPCKLLDSGISMNGAIFSTEFLSSEELGQVEGDGESSGAGAKLTVATYNIPSKAGWGPAEWSKAVTLIKERKMDIVGFQELKGGDSNYKYFKDNLSNFAAFPEKDNNPCALPQSVFYDTNKFNFIKGEFLAFPRYNNLNTNCGPDGGGKIANANSQAPIVWLETKTDAASGNPGGQTVIFMNTHNAANGFGNNDDGCNCGTAQSSERRSKAADIYLAKIQQLRNENPNIPIIFTGDFNEGTGVRDGPTQNITYQLDQKNLFFCKVTADGTMKTTEFPDKDCSKKNGSGGVDFVYVTPEVEIDKNHVVRGKATSGSDHPRTPIYAQITIPGSGGGGSPQPYRNPLISSTAPDPSIIKGEDGKYYLYTTGFQKFVSDNIVDWKKKEDGISWIKGAPNWSERWAPDIAKVGDTYVLSISGGNGGRRTIGYATSKSAAGPFTYQGELVNPKDRGKYGSGFDIDPNIVQTDEGTYLYYGSGTGFIMAAKLTLKDGKLSAARSQKVFTTKEGAGPTLAEGPYVHKKGEWYYMFYSSGTWQPPAGIYGPFTPYRLHVARSKSPTGPFVGKGKPILESNKAFTSPGHGSVITDEAGTDWKIYMAYPARTTKRAVLIDKITYENGWPVIHGPTSTRQNDGPVAGEGPAGVAGWSWPLKSNVNNGPCYGGSNGHAGMDMNSKTADNPVYAMHSGEVVTVGVDSAAGNYITILADAKVNGKPVYYSYEHLKSGSIKVKKGDKVSGGKQVAIAGLTGNVQVSSSKAHLHIVTATTNTLGAYGKLGTTFDPMNILMSAGPAPNGYKCT